MLDKLGGYVLEERGLVNMKVVWLCATPITPSLLKGSLKLPIKNNTFLIVTSTFDFMLQM